MKTALEVLRGARALLSDEKRWGKYHSASDSYGNSVDATSGNAVCWCSYGAIDYARGPGQDDGDGAELVLTQALPAPFNAVSVFNDHESTTHADVVAAFSRAIAAEETRT